MKRRDFLKLSAGAAVLAQFPLALAGDKSVTKVVKTDAEWRAQLTDMQYKILRKAGTERAYTGPDWDTKDDGVYHCAGCDTPLYSSATKYESGTGWPSFWQPIKEENIGVHLDFKLIYPRKEVRCAVCDGHLGHVFKDGPPPTGLRYCMNGYAMVFKPA